ncbi:DMT family transporter [Candidatus Woesearchaeota archaeon]|nr:DMT family transporter [Candidatus Woesearchaeota archaeon]
MDTKTIGVLAILGASLMWALEPIFAKLAYASADFLQTSTIRAIIVGLVAACYIVVTNKNNFKVNLKEFSYLCYLALFGTLIADLLYFYALTKIPVVNAVLIGHMQPIFIVLLGYFVLKEDKLNKYDYFGIIIMMVAGLLVTTQNMNNLMQLKLGSWGDFLVVLATLAWTTTAIVMRKYLKHAHAGVVTFYRYGISAVVFVVYLLLKSSISLPTLYQIAVGIIVGIGAILYYEGLKRIKAAQVSALELSTPFFAVFLSFFVLGERSTIMQISGILLLFVGVYFLSKKEQ